MNIKESAHLLSAASLELRETLLEKNKSYGNSFLKAAEILEILYPDGIAPSQYRDILLTVRILDKLSRIANDKEAFGEDPYKDIAGYGVLAYAFANIN